MDLEKDLQPEQESVGPSSVKSQMAECKKQTAPIFVLLHFPYFVLFLWLPKSLLEKRSHIQSGESLTQSPLKHLDLLLSAGWIWAIILSFTFLPMSWTVTDMEDAWAFLTESATKGSIQFLKCKEPCILFRDVLHFEWLQRRKNI